MNLQEGALKLVKKEFKHRDLVTVDVLHSALNECAEMYNNGTNTTNSKTGSPVTVTVTNAMSTGV